MGTASGDTGARIRGRVSEPLRVELGAGIAELRGSDSRVAAGGGAVLQLEGSGGRDWGFCGGWEREGNCG
ncbi:unnamed protein product [Linum tenue]|uniref:Uncharacterized protein n=1 Tax=Linum tenue TaxID=586396 RepID=A0AAV0JS54_9ROSI|nr:unnamed protein product [Linum tenue]